MAGATSAAAGPPHVVEKRRAETGARGNLKPREPVDKLKR